ncbi:unnamed protein product [Phytophthora fragariaefolia]|uniref:Unnamed protein product n=1 Tax=Phytophthora fragariaefolia TaxID=1490495 RepID=A0A9W7CTA1_9STRA|nr:unnamed protein product [Phytophthora fragariaefolia]
MRIALQEEYSHPQARTPATVWQGNSAPVSAQGGSPDNGATSGPVPTELGLAEQRDIRCFGCGRLGHMKRVCPARGRQKPSFGKSSGSKGRVQLPRPTSQGNPRKSSDRRLVVHGRVWGYEYPIRILIDSGASKNFARRQSVARNADKFADALRENSGAGPVSVRFANGTLVEVPRVLMDLSVHFEDFDNTERFIVSRWTTLVSHVPTSVKSKGVRQDRQGASAPEVFMGVAELFGVPQEVTVDSLKESAEAPPGVKPSEPREASRSAWASCPACGTTKSVDPDTGSRRAVRSSTDKVLRAAHQVGNLVPPEQGISRREPSVGSPKAKAPQTRSSDGHYHVFDSETGLRVKADAVLLEALPEVAELLNLEVMSLDDFWADLKTGKIAEMVLLRPEPTPEELNSSSGMDEDVLEAPGL